MPKTGPGQGFPKPSDDQRCTAISKRSGRRCPNYRTGGEETCVAHTAGRGSLVIRDPAAAQARSIEAARQKKEKLEREEYVRTLGYKEQLRYRLASKASMVADVIEGMLQDPDPNIRLRAAQEWANRVYGRPHTTAVVVEAPVESPIVQAFMELSPDERRALLRQGAAQIPPEHSDEA